MLGLFIYYLKLNRFMKKKIAISQSNYIPWKGYFDFINSVDEFVLLDDVQYTRRDWRNRNKIKTEHGLKWLTIPVSAEFDDKICEVKTADREWPEKHWSTLRHNYGSTAHWGIFSTEIENLYSSISSRKLSDINYHFLKGINKMLNIETPITWSMDYKKTGKKSDRLISICRQAGADIYVTGPAAKNYLDEELFTQNGITVEWMDYTSYKKYPQLYGGFEHGVTILDLLFNTGEKAREYLKL